MNPISSYYIESLCSIYRFMLSRLQFTQITLSVVQLIALLDSFVPRIYHKLLQGFIPYFSFVLKCCEAVFFLLTIIFVGVVVAVHLL